MIIIFQYIYKLLFSDSEESTFVFVFIVTFMYFRLNADKSIYVNVFIFLMVDERQCHYKV
jgi:hypothetical protein